MLSAVTLRDLRSYLVTPFGWLVFAVVTAVLAYLFLEQVEHYVRLQSRLVMLPNAPGITQLVVAQWMNSCAWVLLLVIPLMTMRTFSEEWRGATMALLLTAPLSSVTLVWSKFISVLIFFWLLLLVLAFLPLSLLLGTDLDLGLVAAGMLGLLLYSAACIAIGVYISLLSRLPWVAAVLTLGVLAMLSIVRHDGSLNMAVTPLTYLSPATHFEAFTRGIVTLANLVYFLVLIVTMLALSVVRFAYLRRSG